MHLIANARDAMEENGGILKIRTRTVRSTVEIIFSDTGKGIEELIIKNIFNPFVTTKGPLGGGSQPGKGLGLSVAYGIIKSHNGDIKIASDAGSGTTVSVNLPVKTMTKKPQKASMKGVKELRLTKS